MIDRASASISAVVPSFLGTPVDFINLLLSSPLLVSPDDLLALSNY
jgi:hypothetical protein